MDTVLMRSPAGEVKEIEATAAALTPLMAAGWHQAPAKKADDERRSSVPPAPLAPAAATEEEK
jgi:hypothetical protein